MWCVYSLLTVPLSLGLQGIELHLSALQWLVQALPPGWDVWLVTLLVQALPPGWDAWSVTPLTLTSSDAFVPSALLVWSPAGKKASAGNASQSTHNVTQKYNDYLLKLFACSFWVSHLFLKLWNSQRWRVSRKNNFNWFNLLHVVFKQKKFCSLMPGEGVVRYILKLIVLHFGKPLTCLWAEWARLWWNRADTGSRGRCWDRWNTGPKCNTAPPWKDHLQQWVQRSFKDSVTEHNEWRKQFPYSELYVNSPIPISQAPAQLLYYKWWKEIRAWERG